VVGSGGYLPTLLPLRLQDGQVLTAGFYHRRRAISYTNLHMASGYLFTVLLRHYQQAVEPNLQRHPYTTIGADRPVGRLLHGPRLGYLFTVFLRLPRSDGAVKK